jgi:hypothetical protein
LLISHYHILHIYHREIQVQTKDELVHMHEGPEIDDE